MLDVESQTNAGADFCLQLLPTPFFQIFLNFLFKFQIPENTVNTRV